MKKSLVLAMAMALGVTASAYAANPFSDVPAGHWAYDSISKLAAAGVIEGYGDDTFRGDRLMTRFEMAQIVAKAMAKGANTDKLAAEFADELDALGIRVAALEKKSDNVRVTGNVRFKYQHNKDAARNTDRMRNGTIRSRLFFTGKVNDNWNYVGMLQNNQELHGPSVGEEQTDFQRAYVKGRLGGLKVFAGRDNNPVFGSEYIYDACFDAVKLTYGDKVYVSGAYGKLTDINEDAPTTSMSDKFWQAEIGTNTDGFVNAKAGYFSTELGADGKAWAVGEDKLKVWYVGADFNLGNDLAFNAMYLRSNADTFNDPAVGNFSSKKNGYVFGLAYKGAEAAEPGTWGLAANYYHQGRGTYLAHTIDGYTDFASGFKGWSVSGDYAVAKNVVLGLAYYDTKALKSAVDKQIDGSKAKVLWSELDFYF